MTIVAEERGILLEQRVKGASGRWVYGNGEEDSISIGSSSSLYSNSSPLASSPNNDGRKANVNVKMASISGNDTGTVADLQSLTILLSSHCTTSG